MILAPENDLRVWWFSGVHLVNTDDQLLDTKGEGQEGVFTGLTVLGDTSFEFTNTSSNDEDSAISLGGTSNHVLDEITVTWSVNNGDIVLVGFELPESNIDGDTTFTFSLNIYLIYTPKHHKNLRK